MGYGLLIVDWRAFTHLKQNLLTENTMRSVQQKVKRSEYVLKPLYNV